MLNDRLSQLTSLVSSLSTSESQAPPPPKSTDTTPRSFKLEFPRFDGQDPTGWIFKANRFFAYHHTPSDQRLNIASFHMDGPALAWFQWMDVRSQFPSWGSFTTALESRFGDSPYTDHRGDLSKLTQTTSVHAYNAAFESKANRTSGIPDDFLLSCYIAGLKPDIRREVQVLRPATLIDAQGLAKIQEDKFSDQRRSLTRTPPRPPLLPTPSSSKEPSQLPIRCLTPDELQSRKEKGLCFNCDEKYHRGHRCQKQFLVLIADDDSPPTLLDIPPAQPDLPLEPPPEISLYALAGHLSPRTLRITGYIHNHPVQVLVDSGSTHNFIQARVTKHLHIPTDSTTSFPVSVGNGEQLQCIGQCSAVPLVLATHSFAVDLFVLPLHGADVVLGVQWLQHLGPVTFNYQDLSLTFLHHGNSITLHGDSSPSFNSILPSQLHKDLTNESVASLYQLWMEPTPPTSSTSTSSLT